MERFRELLVFGEREILQSLIARIETLLTKDWWRDRRREMRLWSPPGESQFVFIRRSRAGFPAIALVLCVEARRLSITNIVADHRELKRSEYNKLLCEFYLEFLHPAVLYRIRPDRGDYN